VTVEAGNIGLDVQERRAVQDIDAAYRKHVSPALQEPYHGNADAVRPAGMTCGEDAVGRVVQEGVTNQFTRFRPVEVIKEVEVAEKLDVQQPFGELFEYLHGTDGVRPEGALDRRLLLGCVVGMDDSYCLNPDFHDRLPCQGADAVEIEERRHPGDGVAEENDRFSRGFEPLQYLVDGAVDHA